MTKPIGITKKRKFHGNRHTVKNSGKVPVMTPDKVTDKASDANSSDKKVNSASSKKCKYIDACDPNIIDDSLNSGNIIMNLKMFNQLVESAVCCKYCKNNSVRVTEIISKRKGLASLIQFLCDDCNKTTESYSSPFAASTKFEVNLRFVYGMRVIGKGQQGAESLCATMNLPPPPSRFQDYNTLLRNYCEDVANECMQEAAKEASEFHIEEDTDNDDDLFDDVDDDEDESNVEKLSNVGVIMDGSWQKRGHTSLNGFVSACSFDTGKILDVECMSKFCHSCKTNKKPCKQESCMKNYEGVSGGMESQGAVSIFKRSVEKYNLRYVKYLGDGDSKGYQDVQESEPYGSNVKISKLECVGHVQKRMGSRLRTKVKAMKGKKLSDGKIISGKGRLTKKTIDSLQNYFGLAIRRNRGNLKAMRKDVWATFFHRLSTDEKPNHHMCPKGVDSWCKFERAKVTKESYTHKNSLPEAVMNEIKPIFQDLSKEELLEKCLHGQTQNVNECFNGVVWSRLPKTVFIGLETFKLGVYDSVITFNEGNLGRIKVLQHITGADAGVNSIIGYRQMDKQRVKKADRAQKENQKQKRQRKRGCKRKLEDEEEFYKAGAFE